MHTLLSTSPYRYKTQWWSPPQQRQRWSDSRNVFPLRGGWINIFFDLFFVAGCINLGTILKETAFHSNVSADEEVDGGSDDGFHHHLRSIIYFFGTGLNVFMMWFDKLHYDARFTLTTTAKTTTATTSRTAGVTPTGRCDFKNEQSHHEEHDDDDNDDDIFHRCLEVLQICAVATALSRIRSPEILSDMCQHNDMFLFSFSLLLNSIITMLRYLEVYLFVVECDVPAAKVAAIHDMGRGLIPSFFYLLATVESGYLFYHANRSYRDDTGSCDIAIDYNDRPLYCCLAGWLSYILIGYVVDVMVYDGPGSKQHRIVERSVPRNIHFCIHRYGEWFMLMFGESIISLIIVDGHNESVHYKLAFFSGIVSVMVLAHWHFGAQPNHADDHALSRSRHSSFLYTALMPLYSLALIAVGVSYKLFLYEYTYRDDAAHRRLGGGDNYAYESGSQYDTIQSDQDELRQQFAANLFCVSMAAVLVCMDLGFFLHKGLPRLRHEIQQVSRLPLFGFFVSKYTVVVALATFSLHHNDPHVMAVCCLGAMLLLEFLSNIFSRHLRPRRNESGARHDSDPAGPKSSSSNDPEGPSKGNDNDSSQFVEVDDNDSIWFTTAGARSTKRCTLALFERQALMNDDLWSDQESVMDDGCSTTLSNRQPSSDDAEKDVRRKHPNDGDDCYDAKTNDDELGYTRID